VRPAEQRVEPQQERRVELRAEQRVRPRVQRRTEQQVGRRSERLAKPSPKPLGGRGCKKPRFRLSGCKLKTYDALSRGRDVA